MPPRSLSGLSNRSPVCVTRFDDYDSCSSTQDKGTEKRSVPLVRNVTFAAQNEVFEITHLDDIPAEDVANIWYDAGEYADIKKSYQLTIFLMESGEKLKGDDHTSRGLEYRTQDGAWARYENKRDAYNAVLDEQDRQWKEDIDDWDKISQVYLEHSTKCLLAARGRGDDDEKAIAKYIRSSKSSGEKKKKKKSSKDKDGKEKKSSRKNSLSSKDSKESTDSRRSTSSKSEDSKREKKSSKSSKSKSTKGEKEKSAKE